MGRSKWKDPELRFWYKVTITPDCWIWDAGVPRSFGFSVEESRKLRGSKLLSW